jgi:hypothetical protein
LTGAYLIAANLNGANLTDADLTDTDLTGIANLSQSQLDKACGTPTKLPPDLILNKPCPARKEGLGLSDPEFPEILGLCNHIAAPVKPSEDQFKICRVVCDVYWGVREAW